MEENEKKQKVLKILSYWHTLSFLNQSDFAKPSHSESVTVRKWKRTKKCPINNRQHTYTWFENFHDTDSLKDIIERIPECTGWLHHGKITIYYGHVNRDSCISHIAQTLHYEIDEKDMKNKTIALLSLQLNPDGTYIKNTFSFSPIVWAIGTINGSNKKTLDNTLSMSAYLASIKDYEECLAKYSSADADNYSDDHPEMFADNAVSADCLNRIAGTLIEKYLPDSISVDKSGTMFLGIAKARTDLEEEDPQDDYLPLSSDFYSLGIEKIQQDMKRKNYGNTENEKLLLNYIFAPYEDTQLSDEEKMKNRIEVVHPKSFSSYQSFMDDILNIRNAPLGKWPAGFTLSAMQQVAINEAVSLVKTDKMPIFSVNGPPGTGKTTMLKEIAANNIVERALLLAKYDYPDDAFKECSFKEGPLEDHAYSNLYKHYYMLKNDHINDYGILVASNNNAAVDNITIDFPRLDKLLDGLKTDSSDEKKSSALQQIEFLFNPNVSDEVIYKNKNEHLVKDVYFTSFGSKLLSSKKNRVEAWGLIGASLGNRQKISDYCNCYLNDILYNCFSKKGAEEMGDLDERWQDAVHEFQTQYQKVLNMRDHISHECDQLAVLHAAFSSLISQIEELSNEAEDLSRKKAHEEKNLVDIEKQLDTARKEADLYQKEVFQQLEHSFSAFNKENEPLKNSYEIQKNIYQKAVHASDNDRKQLLICNARIAYLNNQITAARNELTLKEKELNLKRIILNTAQEEFTRKRNALKESEARENEIQAQLQALYAANDAVKSTGLFTRFTHDNRLKTKELKAQIREKQSELNNANADTKHLEELLNKQLNLVKSDAASLSEAFDDSSKKQQDLSSFKEELDSKNQSLSVLKAQLEKDEITVDQERRRLNAHAWNTVKAAYEKELDNYNTAKRKNDDLIKNVNNAASLLENSRKFISKADLRLRQIKKEKEKLDQKTADNKFSQKGLADKIHHDPLMKEMVIPDTDYLMDMVSPDPDRSRKAQSETPWFTFQYDLEREKLFRLALKVNKYFILDSKACNCNLNHFYAYQTYQYARSQEQTDIRFTDNDRHAFISPVYQTLFLLTPIISTTFASVDRFLKDVNPHSIGTLVIDEAGQAEPQCALSAMNLCRYSIVVGDPKQIEPVVNDDLRLLKQAFTDDVTAPYKFGGSSVQRSADLMNPIGSVTDSDYSRGWIGSPLLVHRRCISPMFEISNDLSYDNTMKQQTSLPDAAKRKTFAGNGSRWYQVNGHETQGHGVDAQNECALQLLEEAFNKADGKEPSIFIISPFTTAASSFHTYVLNYCNRNRDSSLNNVAMNDWLSNHVGTVHKFQGREADQVIFLLGCDRHTSSFAIKFVSRNIVNVAVTRAKYRLFAIGDTEVWEKNQYVSLMIRHLFLYSWTALQNLSENDEDYSRKAAELISALPDAASFDFDEIAIGENGEKDYKINSQKYEEELMNSPFLHILTDKDLEPFGINRKDLANWDISITVGLETYYTLGPIVQKANLHRQETLAAEPGIILCRGMEMQLNTSVTPFLKKALPAYSITVNNKIINLKDCKADDLTIGIYTHILDKQKNTLAKKAKELGHPEFDAAWWDAFDNQLHDLKNLRNSCCHCRITVLPGKEQKSFSWRMLQNLLRYMFTHGNSRRNTLSTGIMQACDKIRILLS